MMTVHLLCVGRLKEKYLADACKEYQKRLGAFCRLNLVELPEYRLPDNPSAAEIAGCIRREGEEILARIPRDALVIPMCIEGKQLSSEELSEELTGAGVRGISQVCFVIGGSEGMSESLKQQADFRLSVSDMTFPHHLVRVMALEQL